METSSLTSQSIVGHQKRCWSTTKVLYTPGWQVKEVEWPKWMTADQRCWETNRQLGCGKIWLTFTGLLDPLLYLPLHSAQHAWMREDRRWFFGDGLWTADTGRGIWLSGLMTWAKKGRNWIYRAWWQFNRLAEWKYSRFLWSVQTRKGHSVPSDQCLSKASFTASNSLLPMS